MQTTSLLHVTGALGALMLLSNCVGAPAPHQAPAPQAQPAAPPPASPPAPVSANWSDWPVAPGTWSYRPVANGTAASFGRPGEAAQLSFRCEPATRRVFVARMTTLPRERISGQMTVHTSFGETQWPVTASTEPGVPAAYAVAVRAASDAAFDRIAFSRGRFAVEAPGASPLAVPGWAEVSRVIEDCRG